MSSSSVCNHFDTCDWQIGLPLGGCPILLIAHMITDLINKGQNYWALIGWERGHFFLIEGIFSNQERAWLPVNDWLIRCIATVRYLEICYQVFVATMACRFIEADDELIELLKCESENKNTKRSTGYWKGIFEKWAKDKNRLRAWFSFV